MGDAHILSGVALRPGTSQVSGSGLRVGLTLVRKAEINPIPMALGHLPDVGLGCTSIRILRDKWARSQLRLNHHVKGAAIGHRLLSFYACCAQPRCVGPTPVIMTVVEQKLVLVVEPNPRGSNDLVNTDGYRQRGWFLKRRESRPSHTRRAVFPALGGGRILDEYGAACLVNFCWSGGMSSRSGRS